jgi:hypothetical protein
MDASWQGYITALGAQKPPASNIDVGFPFPNTEGNTTSSGFIEWKAKDPKTQAKYDAMSDSWQGVKASESASASSIFRAEFMPLEHK